MLPLLSVAASNPMPSLPSPTVFPSYARPRAAATLSRLLPVPPAMSSASFSAFVAVSTSCVERIRRSNAGLSWSSAVPVSLCCASIIASTCVVASSNPRFPRVVASFAAAASSSINALTPSTPNLTAIAPAAIPAPSRAGPNMLVRLDPRLDILDPNPDAVVSAWFMLRLKFAVSAAR